MPTDGITMKIDYQSCRRSPVPSIGIGGTAETYRERAVLLFPDHELRVVYAYRIDLSIIGPQSDIMGAPSLLGRDVLNQWRMDYSPPEGWLVFCVATADRVISS